jgi:hypothetical protein
MPVMILAMIMVMMAAIVSFMLVITWQRIPAAKWFGGGVALLFAGAIVAGILHMRAALADITAGQALIKTGRATNKRTAGRGDMWHYTTFENVGEVEVTREQYEAVAIGSPYSVSYSPRVSRAWTVGPTDLSVPRSD